VTITLSRFIQRKNRNIGETEVNETHQAFISRRGVFASFTKALKNCQSKKTSKGQWQT